MGYHKGSGHSSIHMHVELDVPQETVLGPLMLYHQCLQVSDYLQMTMYHIYNNFVRSYNNVTTLLERY